MPKLATRRLRQAVGLLGLVLAAGSLACDRGGAEPADPALDEREFEDIMVELRLAEREAAAADDPGAEFERRKQEILDRYGATEEDLRAFTREAARDLERLTALWDRISQRLRSPAGREEAL